jgi:short-subunit dehydrogenase
MEDWKTTFEVNFFGVVNLIKILLPYIKKSSAGHIVNIGSMGGV